MSLINSDQMKEELEFVPAKDMEVEECVGALSEVSDWGLMLADIGQAHKKSKGSGVTVAVLDTGFFDHVDLHDNLLAPLVTTSDNNPNAVQAHGVHVQGIVGACANGFGVVGVAPECKILSVKVLNNSGTSTYYEIAKGLQLAAENGADIINMSLGSQQEPPAVFHEVIKDLYNKGIIIIAAAGNDSGAVNFPARYNEVVAVAAISPDGSLARFSSRGPEVVASAPGTNIYSTVLDNQYGILSGTSQASPFVSGICALMLSWARSNSDKLTISNTTDMLKVLDDICDPVGRISAGSENNIGFGIPSFANYMPWKEN